MESKIMRKAEEKKQEEDNGQKITIGEEVRLPETDVILEKGDEIKIYPTEQEEESSDEKEEE